MQAYDKDMLSSIAVSLTALLGWAAPIESEVQGYLAYKGNPIWVVDCTRLKMYERATRKVCQWGDIDHRVQCFPSSRAVLVAPISPARALLLSAVMVEGGQGASFGARCWAENLG